MVLPCSNTFSFRSYPSLSLSLVVDDETVRRDILHSSSGAIMIRVNLFVVLFIVIEYSATACRGENCAVSQLNIHIAIINENNLQVNN